MLWAPAFGPFLTLFFPSVNAGPLFSLCTLRN